MKTLDLFHIRVWLTESPYFLPPHVSDGQAEGSSGGAEQTNIKGLMVIPGADQPQPRVTTLADRDEMPSQRPAC